MADGRMADLDQAAERAANFLRSVAHPGRLRIICQLMDGEQTAGQLVAGTGLRAPALSQQAAILEAEGLLERRRDAQNVFYRLVGAQAPALAKFLHQLFCGKPSARRRAR